MHRPTPPTLSPLYVYAVAPINEDADYSLCIYYRDSDKYFFDQDPLAAVDLPLWPVDFKDAIHQAIISLSLDYPEFFVNSLPDSYGYYTNALHAIVPTSEVQ